jgi:DNA-binding transcriptional MocR family regulator
VEAILREYRHGGLPPGTRVPPVRVLRHQLGLAKGTVAAAYDELVALGVLENRTRRGYFVAANAPERSPAAPRVAASPALFKGKISSLCPPSKQRKDRIDLGSVFIDVDLLPRERIAECFRSVLKRPGLHALYDPQGYEPLRFKIAERLRRRGIPARAEDVIITTGSQQALDVITRSLADRSIATEDPAYGIGKLLFEMGGMRVLGLPLNPFRGIDLEIWEKRCADFRPAALYLTTNFHNPTGYSYSTSELLRILELSREYRFGVVEDDWGSDMLSFSEYRPPLRAIGGENVLYLNSFTKKLLPSLRLGYLVANEETRDTLITAKRVGTLANPTLIEAALFEFLDRGYYDSHLKKLQAELDRRYQSCLEILKGEMPEEVRWTTPGGGPILWLELPRRIALDELEGALSRQGILLDLRTRDWFFGPPHLHGIKIGYASSPTAKLEQALVALAKEIRKALAKGNSPNADEDLSLHRSHLPLQRVV